MRMKRFFVVFSTAFGIALTCLYAEEPKVTPTPDPANDLAAIAKKTRIDPNALKSENGAIHITNETLVTSEDGGTISLTGKNPRSADVGAPSATPHSPTVDSPTGDEVQPFSKEAWQARHRELTTRLEELDGEIDEASRELPKIWSRFYEEDDPGHRDSFVRTELNEALDRKARLIQDRRDTQEDLERFFNEARQAGALPGWFRPQVPQPNP